MNKKRIILSCHILALLLIISGCLMNHSKLDAIFENQTDIGSVLHKGASFYDPESEKYHLKGSGANMWFGEDEFHFLYRKITGDFVFDTRIEWIGQGVESHRKAGLTIRETLNPGSRHVSAEFHGDGLMSLQYRLNPDSMTLEQSSAKKYLNVIRLEKTGRLIRMFAAEPGELLNLVGEIESPFDSSECYIGLFVCSHNPDVMEEAVFSNTRLTVPASPDFVPYQDYIGSRLEILDIQTELRKTVYQSSEPFEAPNWSRSGNYLVVNSRGRLYSVPVHGGEPVPIYTDFAVANNNDHGFSPDGKYLAISHHASDRPAGENSVIYTVPVHGGKPEQITENSPSYWHGWSPDGHFLIYTAKRNEQWNIYRVPADGGDELQLTHNPGLDDGSDYSPDGQYIWFNSNRSGSMEIWRMNADGTNEQQMTDDIYQNWFPHPSPDGRFIVFLSYPHEVDPWDHPYYKRVMLRLINLEDNTIRVIAHVYGGQGTINVPSWSPDSRKVAFISHSDRIF